MGALRGRVLQGDSDSGVPDVAVVLVCQDRDGAGGSGASLGAAVTDGGGCFTLTWKSSDVGTRHALRINVLREGSRVLASTVLGACAADDVVLRVVASPDREAPDPAVLLARVQQRLESQRVRAQAQDALRAGVREQLAERVGVEQERHARGHAAFHEFMRTTKDGRHVEGLRQQRLVPANSSVATASDQAIREGIASRVDGAATTGAVLLDEDDARALAGGELSAEELSGRVRAAGGPTMLVRTDVLAGLCDDHHRAEDPCVKALLAVDPTPPPGDNGNAPIPARLATSEPVPVTGPAPAAALPVLVGNLVNGVAAPEQARIFSVSSRAGISDVQEGVNGFSLHSGPADVPAHYEFQHLQIAFEHVWQELFDDKLSHTGAALFAQLVEPGVEASAFFSMEFLKALLAGATTEAPVVVKPPPAVIREFDITPEQYAFLLDEAPRRTENESDHEVPPTDLEVIARSIDRLRTKRDEDIQAWTDFAQSPQLFSLFPPGAFDDVKRGIRERCDVAVREARRNGDRIVRHAANRLQAPTEFAHFHELLSALEAAMKEPYRFTVYAASPTERSVNFGLVTTYVQSWEPVNYQVGQLVKTVTLAPKEVRRFTKRVSVKRSRAERELQKPPR